MSFLVVAAILAMLILSFGVIFFVILYQRRVIRHQEEIRIINEQKQLELIQANLQGEEQERMRIAAELHDDVGTTLASVRLLLHAADTDHSNALITQSKELLDESINRIRSISHKLQPALLHQLGLQASLESFCATISKPGKVKMVCEGDTLPRFAENIELSVYRIVQELTNNTTRHAQATDIVLKTLLLPAHLRVSMTHNGEGLTEESFRQHLDKTGAIGLKNIVNRLKSIEAAITFEKIQNGGFSIIITIPIEQVN